MAVAQKNSASSEVAPRTRKWRIIHWLIAGVGILFLAFTWDTAIARFCIWRGQANSIVGQDELALQWLLRGRQFSSVGGLPDYLMARAHRRLGQYGNADWSLLQAERAHWSPADIQRERWLMAAQIRRYDLVQSHWKDLLSNPGEDVGEICNAFVVWCLLQVRPKDALVAIEAWIRDDPAASQPHYLRGLIHDGISEWQLAIKDFKRAIELGPRRADAMFHLAEDLMRLHQHKEAEQEYRRCIETDPTNGMAVAGCAKCLVKLGRVQEAAQLLELKQPSFPDHPEILHALGDIELATGQLALAREHLESALHQQPENQAARYTLARTLQALGEADAAKEQFSLVEESQRGLSRLTTLSHQLVKAPDDLDIRYEWAWLTLRYQSRKEGAARLEGLLTQVPDHLKAHAALAEYYTSVGELERAAFHKSRVQAANAVRTP